MAGMVAPSDGPQATAVIRSVMALAQQIPAAGSLQSQGVQIVQMATPTGGAVTGRDALLRDSARLALLREQLMVPANAVLAYGQLLQAAARPDSREAGYVARIVAAARQVADRLGDAGPALAAADDPLLLRRLRHDLRSPLGAVKGFAELLVADGAPLPRAELERILERVDAILERLDCLVAGGAAEPDAAELAAALAATAGALPEPATSPGRVLVVDDDEHNRPLLVDILTLAGHTVDAVASDLWRSTARPRALDLSCSTS